MTMVMIDANGLTEWVTTLPLIVLAMGAVAGAAVWYSPSGCGWVAQTLRARKAGLEVYRRTYNELRPGRRRVIGYEEDDQPIYGKYKVSESVEREFAELVEIPVAATGPKAS